MYCTLLPVRQKGDVVLPAAVAAYMDKVAAEPAVKAGTEQVRPNRSLTAAALPRNASHWH